MNSLSPQEIRNRIMDSSSDFQTKMIEYLESAHQAEYVDSDLDTVKPYVLDVEKSATRPSELLPDPPPPFCDCSLESCITCKVYQDWKDDYKNTLNHILYRANRHTCSKTNCRNKYNMCKARFPRQVFESSMVDPETGAVCMKHKEPMLNTFNPVMAYLQRCNSDATSLLSGTAIKSAVAYITDYITKCSVNTHVIFESVKIIFEKFPNLKGGSDDAGNKSRQLLTKLCNSLVSKLEIGGPMACMYLLGNPDHYTDHTFVNLFWRSFVNEVLRTCTSNEETINDIPEHYVVITKGLTASSPIYDYIYRPLKYSNMCLYDWIQQVQKVKGGTQRLKKLSKVVSHPDDECGNENEDDDNLKVEENFNTGEKRNRDADNEHNGLVDYSDMYLENHPQRQTHQAHLLPYTEYSHRVPNFLGGSLPRRDAGDVDNYAATMLTLFKPWRNGTDLKQDMQMWNEAFQNFKFSDKCLSLMDKFNLRYECSDAEMTLLLSENY